MAGVCGRRGVGAAVAALWLVLWSAHGRRNVGAVQDKIVDTAVVSLWPAHGRSGGVAAVAVRCRWTRTNYLAGGMRSVLRCSHRGGAGGGMSQDELPAAVGAEGPESHAVV